jgi:uncharacterized membrane protein YccC
MPTDKTNTERQRTYRQRQKEARAAAIVNGAPAAPAIPTMPSRARWAAMYEQATEAVQTMHNEMQEYYDERSEDWQESDKGDEFMGRMEGVETILLEMSGWDFS